MTSNPNLPDEANRYDGAPAPDNPNPGYPSKPEMDAENRRKLANTGCEADGCDVADPDDLGWFYPDAKPPGRTRFGGDPIVLCTEHAEARND